MKKILCVIAIILLVAETGSGQKIRVNKAAQPFRYVFTEYFPANYLDESGKPTGFFVDIVKGALQDYLGIPVSIQVFPWRRCQFMVEQGSADMITTIPTSERLAYTVKVNSPIWIKRYRIYTWTGHPALAKMNTIKNIYDLKKRELSVISYLGNNWSETIFKKAGIPILNANTVDGMYLMLNSRRGDTIIDDPVLVDPKLKSLKLGGRIVPTSGIVEDSYFYPLIGKKSPYVSIADDFAAALTKMRQDGTIKSIMERYRTR
ncbi:MAG: transporter substrate-binding domain-containing protein [Spirochaetes bacterium]|nr:transporter substrate-binding domain-containing protein [Spirochaetota bacterium]